MNEFRPLHDCSPSGYQKKWRRIDVILRPPVSYTPMWRFTGLLQSAEHKLPQAVQIALSRHGSCRTYDCEADEQSCARMHGSRLTSFHFCIPASQGGSGNELGCTGILVKATLLWVLKGMLGKFPQVIYRLALRIRSTKVSVILESTQSASASTNPSGKAITTNAFEVIWVGMPELKQSRIRIPDVGQGFLCQVTEHEFTVVVGYMAQTGGPVRTYANHALAPWTQQVTCYVYGHQRHIQADSDVRLGVRPDERVEKTLGHVNDLRILYAVCLADARPLAVFKNKRQKAKTNAKLLNGEFGDAGDFVDVVVLENCVDARRNSGAT